MNLFSVQTKHTYLEKDRPWQFDPTEIPATSIQKYLHWADTNDPQEVFEERQLDAQMFNVKYNNWQGEYVLSIVSVRRFSDAEVKLRQYQAQKYPERCCNQAVLRNCVCRVSFLCPEHGVSCHGNHE